MVDSPVVGGNLPHSMLAVGGALGLAHPALWSFDGPILVTFAPDEIPRVMEGLLLQVPGPRAGAPSTSFLIMGDHDPPPLLTVPLSGR